MLSLKAIQRQTNSRLCTLIFIIFHYLVIFLTENKSKKKSHRKNENSLRARTCDLTVALNNV